MNFKLPRLATLALLLVPAGAYAHHGREMFDMARTLTATGVVKDWQWTNPHAWIELAVEDKGTIASFEGNSITILTRQGWKRGSIKVGDKITVTYHPLVNGKPGGDFIQVTDSEGKTLQGGPGGPPPAAPAK